MSNKVKVGDPVVIDGKELDNVTGTVIKIHESKISGESVVIVKTLADELVKCLARDLVVITPKANAQEKTITRAEFREIAVAYVSERKHELSPYQIAVICGELETALFGELV